MGFDGEHIAEMWLKKKGYKNVKLTRHKHDFDVLSDKHAWEVKGIGIDSSSHKMSITKEQKIDKLKWAKKNKKKPMSVMVIMNDGVTIHIREGLGRFMEGGMPKVGASKNWRKVYGHGRTHRLVETKVRTPKKVRWVDATDFDDAQKQFQEHFGIDVKYEGYNVEQKRASAWRYTNLMGKEYDRIAREFDLDMKKIKGSLNKLIIENNEYATVKGRGIGIAYYWEDLKQIKVAGEAMYNPKVALTKGGHTVGGDMGSMIRHEIGHSINSAYSTKPGFWEEFRRLVGDFWKADTEMHHKWKKAVSRYADTNMNEAFSECFAFWTSPLYGSPAISGVLRELPDGIELFMKKWFPKKGR